MRNLSNFSSCSTNQPTQHEGVEMTVIAFPGTSFPRVTSPARTTQPRLRLTSRGRLVFGALAAIPIAMVLTIVGINASDAAATQLSGTQAPASNDFTYVSIAPGESLWQLASQIAPQADPDEVVADILALNQLRSADVQPGQELAIPLEYTR
jgi:LysM repeat protein